MKLECLKKNQAKKCGLMDPTEYILRVRRSWWEFGRPKREIWYVYWVPQRLRFFFDTGVEVPNQHQVSLAIKMFESQEEREAVSKDIARVFLNPPYEGDDVPREIVEPEMLRKDL